MWGVGVPELVILLMVFLPPVAVTLLFVVSWRRKAKAGGHASLMAYLRATPQSDDERRDAASMAIKGLVVCFLGLLFKPLVLIGLFPLVHGARKVLWALMGLSDLIDTQEPGAPIR
jgi:Na+/proline symporter